MSIVDKAMVYAERNWHVFPIHSIVDGRCTCSKGDRCPEGNWGKHPIFSGGHKKATCDLKKVYGLFSAPKTRKSNIGISTGFVSRLLVLDIDPRNGGTESLQALVNKYPGFIDALQTYSVKTGGGGFHYYYQLDRNFNSVKKHGLGAGIDVKAGGGYVVAPPSIHASGNNYQIYQDIPLLPVPDIIWSLLDFAPERVKITGLDSLIEEGNRNNALANLAAELFRNGERRDSIRAKLFEFNAFNCSPALEDKEVESIYRSINTSYQEKETQKSIKTRWQEAILESGESGDFIKVVIGLSLWMNTEGRNCFPNQDDIAKRFSVSKPTVIKHLKKAEKDGWLEIYTIPGRYGGYSNGYRAVFPKWWVKRW